MFDTWLSRAIGLALLVLLIVIVVILITDDTSVRIG